MPGDAALLPWSGLDFFDNQSCWPRHFRFLADQLLVTIVLKTRLGSLFATLCPPSPLLCLVVGVQTIRSV